MSNRSVKYIPFDLRSHFITHSYLTLLENLTSDSPQTTEQSLHSFLFICNHTPKYTSILQQQIFDFYLPQCASSPLDTFKNEQQTNPIGAKVFYSIKSNLSFMTLNKAYSKFLLKAKSPIDYEQWTKCNLAYIHLHQSLSASIPLPLPLEAEQFIEELLGYSGKMSS
ncbi:MAG: hypothetical protein ACRCW2_12785 [Cellulosilyticaceae bacterium]